MCAIYLCNSIYYFDYNFRFVLDRLFLMTMTCSIVPSANRTDVPGHIIKSDEIYIYIIIKKNPFSRSNYVNFVLTGIPTSEHAMQHRAKSCTPKTNAVSSSILRYNNNNNNIIDTNRRRTQKKCRGKKNAYIINN